MSEEKKSRPKQDPKRFDKALERAVEVIKDYLIAGMVRYEKKHGGKALMSGNTLAQLAQQIISQAILETSYQIDGSVEVATNKKNEYFVAMNGRIFDEDGDFRDKELNIAFGGQPQGR